MTHPITCPHCERAFDASEALVNSVRDELTSTIEADLREATQKKLAQREADLTEHFGRQLAREKEAARDLGKQLEAARAAETALRKRERELQQREADVDLLLERRLGEELHKVRKEERALGEQRLERRLGEELDKAREVDRSRSEAQAQELARYKARAQEAEQREFDLREQKKKLDEEKEQMELEMRRRVDAERAAIRRDVLEKTTTEHELQLREKNEIIEQMRKKVAEAEQKAQQTSQQAQGEAQELVLLDVLREAFGFDLFEEIDKGVEGADILQTVRDGQGRSCGTILWESKRTKHFQKDWLPKVRADQREAKADCTALVSSALPPHVLSMECIDGVWVAGFAHARPLAALLRERLLEVHRVAMHHEGIADKKELVYRYLTSTEFQQRVQQSREAVDRLRTSLQKEKTAIQKLWLQREQDIDAVATGMGGIHRDLKVLAGADVEALPDIEGADQALAELADARPLPDDATLEDKLLEALRDQGGSAGNIALRTKLGWAEAEYDRIKNRLVARGIILPGKGRGGSVSAAAPD